ncbi:hypothetical protein [Cesiribacter sp. SM1]|uniref:hypothetical protein n=1 Tax=Cesiribacter sp. SM1 TaxID=2861196 RepID=UPI001CD3C931|nr:hypothetical protein [Cesiribacter sp. SM1]
MGYSEKIQEVLNVRKGEGKIVSMLMLYSFFQAMALALFFTAAGAIFLTHYPITNLPYVYIAAGILLLLVNSLYAQFEKHISGRVLILAEVLILLLSILLFRLGFAYAQAGWRLLEGSTLQLNDAATLELLNNKLDSPYAGEVLYALDVLCKGKGVKKHELLGRLR